MKMEPTVESYPLSPMQEGMLFHSLSAREPGVDIEQILCTLHEDLNVAALQRAWQCVVERHAILRTGFCWQRAAPPRQEVHPHVSIPLEQHDWRGRPAGEWTRCLENYLQAERQRGFDLTLPPLMRLALVRAGEAEYQLVWTLHHLLMDARSFVLVLNETFAAYETYCQGRDFQPDPPRPYRDYIDWLQGQDPSQSEAFWRPRLKGFSAPTPLVVARTASGETGTGDIRGEQEIRLSTAVSAKLKSVAKNNGLTPNTFMQGAWALLLSRYSGEKDVVFGAVRACRRSTVEGAESIVGLFVNTVPVRVRIDPEQRLLPWLAELRNTWVALRPFEHTPLVSIHCWSDVPRGQPLFESVFNFQDPSWDNVLRGQGGKWATRQFGIRSQSNYPLVVDAYGGDALLIKILYHRSRFDDATIGRMLGHLKTLLEGMAANPGQRLRQIPSLTSAERHQLLVEWNDTRTSYPRDQTIPQLFEEQVVKAPNAVAVLFQETRLTYRELNERANQLAHHLQRLGVGPDRLVAICLERSAEMIIGLLGILKAGGAYVSLDPTYPPERLAFMLEDTRALVLLTQAELKGHFESAASDFKIVCQDSDRRAIAHQRRANPVSRATADSLAYVSFTSGSTGRPKGVAVPHRGVVRLVKETNYARFDDGEVFLQLAPIAFDASTLEIWGPLLNGARLVVFPPHTPSLTELGGFIQDHGITTLWLTSGLFHQMVEQQLDRLRGVRQLLAGGDVLSVPHVKKALETLGGCQLINGYGPTENTTFTCCHRVTQPLVENCPIPIGRPIANTQIYILDDHLQPAAIGVPGGLYIGGDGLARGYLDRPGLTAKAFIPHPFSGEPDARLYKTGDLVRWLPDGVVEFLGRIDTQVKIRGFRVELGEVEAVLNQHAAVCECVVTARPDAGGGKQLTAYFLTDAPTPPPTEELREHLRRKLPNYMVPSAFVLLDAWPLTPNGKVDRNALPAPQPSNCPSDRIFAGPRNPIEDTVAKVWSEVLGHAPVALYDNFFELGGHSLFGVQVISRLEGSLQVQIPMRSLFENPTVAELAQEVERMMNRRGASRAPGISRVARQAYRSDNL